MTDITRRRALGYGAAAGALGLFAPAVHAQDFLQKETLKVGIVPYISSGPTFIALAKGYYEKVGLNVEIQSYADGGLAIVPLAAGELDISVTTCSAGIFNTISRGVSFRMFMDRSQELVGKGSQCFMVSNQLHEAGFKSIDKIGLMAGKVIGISVRGSVSHYLLSKAFAKAGAKPDDAEWRFDVTAATSGQLLAANNIQLANLPVPGCFAAEQKGIAKITFWGDDAAPNMQVGCWAASGNIRTNKRSAMVRFAMAQLQATREFMAAADSGDAATVKILADATRLPPAIIEGARPRWSGYPLNGQPNIASVMEQAKFWTDQGLVKQMPTQEQVFELGIAEEALSRLESKNPFI
jgi:NitT/TauT family transport system substrate-binding protein